MTVRNYVPPPDAATSPNGAPGREFWLDRFGGSPDPDDGDSAVPLVATVSDPSLPNLSRNLLIAQLYGIYLAQGNSPSAATTLANARALQMIP